MSERTKHQNQMGPLYNNEIVAEGSTYTVTPGFIDAHSHIGLVRSGEPDREEEANDHFDPIYPLVNALHSIYMDDPSFTESVEGGITLFNSFTREWKHCRWKSSSKHQLCQRHW